jgi:hypothetical protein
MADAADRGEFSLAYGIKPEIVAFRRAMTPVRVLSMRLNLSGFRGALDDQNQCIKSGFP